MGTLLLSRAIQTFDKPCRFGLVFRTKPTITLVGIHVDLTDVRAISFKKN